MSKQPSLKFALGSSLLLCGILASVLPGSQAEMLQLEIPPAENFDSSAGEQLPSPSSDIYYVGAADLSSDGLADLLTAEDEGIKIYANMLGQSEQTRGPFKQQSTSIALDNGYAVLQGQYLEGAEDETIDLVFFTKPAVQYVKQEKTGTVTGLSGHTALSDEGAVWREDELKTLKLRPDASQEKVFEIDSNTPRDEKKNLPPIINVKNVDNADAQTWLDTYTAVGKTYAYEVWTQKQSEPSLLKVYLNEGDANFKEAECQTPIKLDNGRVVTRLAIGNYDDDGINDMALLNTSGITGRVLNYDWEEGQHGNGNNDPDETPPNPNPDITMREIWQIPQVMAISGEDERFRSPFRATLTIQDPNYNFANLPAISGATLIPNVNESYEVAITSWNDNSVSAEIELYGISSPSAGRAFLNSLTAPGMTYAIKMGDFEELLLRGEGGGCYENLQALSGDVYSMRYIDNPEQPGTYWTELTDPAQDFGAEDGLVGRKVYFPMSTDELGDTRYPILHNTANALYLETTDGPLPPGILPSTIDDYVGDGVSEVYLVDPPDNAFVFDESKVQIDKLNTAALPTSYLERINNLRTVSRPVKAAFADFNNDGELDFVYANGYLFFKQNQG